VIARPQALAMMALLFASLEVAAADPDNQVRARPPADALAHAAHLQILRDGANDELRIWVHSVIQIRGRMTGWVATTAGLERCWVEFRLVNEGAEYGNSRCVMAVDPKRARRVLDYLPEMSEGSFRDCSGIIDGAEVTVDGVFRRRRFALNVANPEFCYAPFKELFDFLEATKWDGP